jgi:hypothetical protein
MSSTTHLGAETGPEPRPFAELLRLRQLLGRFAEYGRSHGQADFAWFDALAHAVESQLAAHHPRDWERALPDVVQAQTALLHLWPEQQVEDCPLCQGASLGHAWAEPDDGPPRHGQGEWS